MNKIIRSYKAIRQEKYLIILLPIALLLVPIIILIKNLVLLRFGLIHSDRIGHFVTDTALYLIDKKNIAKKKKLFDFLYFPNTISNQQIEKMWRRKISFSSKYLIRPFWLIFSFFNLREHLAGISETQCRDIKNLLPKNKNIIKFTEEEINYCKSILKINKIDEKKIVLLILRDSNFLKKTMLVKGKMHLFNYHNYRNPNVNTYKKAIKFLLKNNYHIIRMGKHLQTKIQINNKKYIELFSSGFHSDLLEIYLGSICKFCISSSTGYDEVPKIFNRPILYTNVCPLSDIQANSKNFMIIFQRYFDKFSKKELTFSEIVKKECHEIYDSFEFKKKKILLKQNTSDEIYQATKEFLNNISKNSFKKTKLQNFFWTTFKKKVAKKSTFCAHEVFNAKISEFFLKKIKKIIK